MIAARLRRAADRVAGLFDPDALAAGPPPRDFLPFLRWALAGSWPVFWAAMAVSAGLAAAEVASAWLIGWAVDLVAVGAAGLTDPAARAAFLADHGTALIAAGLFVALSRPAFMMALSALSTLALQPGHFQLTVGRLHRHTLGQSLRFFEDDFAGRIAQKQVQTGNAVTELLSEIVQAVAYALASLIAAMLVLGSADPWLAGALAVWVALYALWIGRLLPRLREAAMGRAAAQAALSGQLVDVLGQMETVKLFAPPGREESSAAAALARLRAAKLAFGRLVWVYRAGVAVLAGLLPLILVGLSLALWQSGSGTPGSVALAGLLSIRIAQMSGWISFTAMGMFANVGVVEDGIRTLARPHAMPDAPDARPFPGRARGRLAFEGVTFRYGRAPGDRPAETRGLRGRGGGLDGFALTVEAGEKVALVGRSGAGKSTVMRLALRLDDPEGGRVTLDGHDLRDLAQDGLRRQIALVTQDTAMFNRSAMDNILYGAPGAGPEAAFEAARRARADGFIRDLVDPLGRRGYDAHLGERGVKLSGGQRQRLAIARAILRDAPVLMLDEATSALDSETEAEVQAALEALMQGRTVVAIAHRLGTIARMDRIVVMEAGRVAEQGTHADLLARGGAYARLWARQSGGLLDAAEDAPAAP